MLHVTCDHSLRDAQQDLDAALAMNQSDAVALTLRSRVAFWDGRPHQAVGFAARAAASDPTSPEAVLALGLAYYFDRDFRDAGDTFERLLELMPGQPAALNFLELTDEGLGDYAAAARTVRLAQLDPRNARWVWAARARILAASGHSAEALAMLQRWSSTLDPEEIATASAAAGSDQRAIDALRVATLQNSLNAQVAWLNDFHFAALRRKFPSLTSAFVTWR
jgi:tetratricopeptide (TPR) repeat protein